MEIIVHQVTCGSFGVSEDFMEKYQSLDAKLIRNKEATFFFRAKGESMSPTIGPEDLLIVDRSLESKHNSICIVAYQGELICKRVLFKNNQLILASDNSSFRPICVGHPEDVSLWGVVTARITEMRVSSPNYKDHKQRKRPGLV